MQRCRVCNSQDFQVMYEGQIRSGGVGSPQTKGFRVIECNVCKMASLDPLPKNLKQFYESEEYRSQFDYDTDPNALTKKYAHEQGPRVARIGLENLINKSVLDLGASTGVFLDAVKGYTSRTIAVEPAEMFTSYLKENGHEVFAYPQDALDCKVAVDIVTSFDVIEHLEDPNSFVDAAYELLRPGGKFILSMPNVDDVLLKVCHEKFAPFFFQAAHLNYFGSAAVDFLFSKSQFSKYKIDYIHKYDLTNLMHWLKNGNPGNWTGDNCFDRVSTAHVKADFERLGIASHLFVTGEKI